MATYLLPNNVQHWHLRCDPIGGQCDPTLLWHFFNSSRRNSSKSCQQNCKIKSLFYILQFQLISALSSPLFDVMYLLQLILALNRLAIAIKTIKSPLNADNQSKAEQYFFNVTLFSFLLICKNFPQFRTRSCVKAIGMDWIGTERKKGNLFSISQLKGHYVKM